MDVEVVVEVEAEVLCNCRVNLITVATSRLWRMWVTSRHALRTCAFVVTPPNHPLWHPLEHPSEHPLHHPHHPSIKASIKCWQPSFPVSSYQQPAVAHLHSLIEIRPRGKTSLSFKGPW